MASIDVTEILKASSGQLPAKRSRVDAPLSREELNTATASAADILAALEDDQSTAVAVDAAFVKKLCAQVEKKALRNREMRMRHADEPTRFMDSEIELDTAVQEMTVLATQPDEYGECVACGLPALLLQLLAHENTDIAASCINLLQELTDVDTLAEGDEGAGQLIESLAEGRIIECLVGAMDRLDESSRDDADAVHHALSIVENMVDFRPATGDDCVSQGLFMWLLRRACQKGNFDANKLYSSELLALLMQSTESAKKKLTEKVDGMDLLLRALAAYKRHDPSSLDEREHMENLFDALCAALMWEGNRQKFLDGEGLQLMNLMLRERKQSRESALKVLDHATTGPEGKANCAKFVEILGLRTLFPLFMRTPSRDKKNKGASPDEHEEHVCSILSALMRWCGEESRQRIMQKFVEHEHEKVDRAIELLIKYREKLSRWEARRERQAGGSSDQEDPDALYIDRLDAGLYTEQHLALLLADVCAHTNSARLRAIKLCGMKMKQHKLTKALVPVLSEYQANLGDEADEERNRVDQLIARLSAAENADRQAAKN